MTQEQLEEKVATLAENQAVIKEELKDLHKDLDTLTNSMNAVQSLAEEVHILAVNITEMQKTLDITIKKVGDIEMAEYNRYKENKKAIKNVIVTGITGTVLSAVIAFCIALATKYIKGDL